MKQSRTLLILFLAISLSGCGLFTEPSDVLEAPVSPPSPPPLPAPVEPVPVTFSVLHKADYNLDDSTTVKNVVVLDTQAGYRAELSKYSVEVPKAVDFSVQRVVLATMGTQPSGGYAIGVKSVMALADRVVVTVSLLSPGPGCIHTQAMSNPYEFVQIDTTAQITFDEILETQQCE